MASRRFWPLAGLAAISGFVGTLAGLAYYGASQLTRSLQCEHRDDPAAWGLSCTEVTFPAADGLRITAWLATRPENGPAVVVVHGHGGNRHTSLCFASFLADRYTLLLPDLRGHGDSEGAWTSMGYYERLDVIGAVRYLRQLGYGPIGVLGVSMGAATALLAAADDPDIRAIVADSSFAELRRAVKEVIRMRGYPGFLSGPLAWLSCRTAAWQLKYGHGMGDPVRAIARIAPRPIFLIHGEKDDMILPANAHDLYAAAGEPKELWMLRDVEHARAIDVSAEEYARRVHGFFDRWLLEEEASGAGAARADVGEIGEPAAGRRADQVDKIA